MRYERTDLFYFWKYINQSYQDNGLTRVRPTCIVAQGNQENVLTPTPQMLGPWYWFCCNLHCLDLIPSLHAEFSLGVAEEALCCQILCCSLHSSHGSLWGGGGSMKNIGLAVEKIHSAVEEYLHNSVVKSNFLNSCFTQFLLEI